MAKKRRRRSFVITALLLGFVAALLLAEAGFRALWTLPPWLAEFAQAGLYTDGPDGTVALQPGHRGTLQVADGPRTEVVIDALGMRAAAAASPGADARRVLVVGDSLVFGYGVAGDEALPARIEASLRARGVSAVVGNGGVPSFGTTHAVDRMARLDGPFRADAFVVCGFLGNDALDDADDRRLVYAGLLLQDPMTRLVPVSWRIRLALRSRAALWLENWIHVNSPANSALATVPPDPERDSRLFGMPTRELAHAGLFLDVVDEATSWSPGAPPVLPRVLDTLRDALRRAKEVAKDRPLWFVILPTLWQVDEGKRQARLRELGFDPAAYERGRAQQRWLAVARDLGIRALDVTPVLAAESDRAGLFLADGGHFSVRGNEVVGRWFAAELAVGLR